MTARLEIKLKTTEQYRIARTGKSEADVTNIFKNCARGSRPTISSTIEATKLTTDRHEASCSLFATAELLV